MARPTEDPAELLSEPPTDEDLDDLLEGAATRRRSKLTVGLAAALIFFLGFLVGAAVERISVAVGEAQEAASGETVDLGPTEPSGPIAVGTILVIEDGAIYIQTDDGATVKVLVSATTLLGVSVSAEITDLEPGLFVVVYGEAEEDGIISASTVQQGRP